MHELYNADVLGLLERNNVVDYETSDIVEGKSRKKNSCKWLRSYLFLEK